MKGIPLGEKNNLSDVLVLTVKKGFWTSPESKIFSNRIHAKYLFKVRGRWGSSRNPLNVLNLAIGGYLYCLFKKPKVILFGAAPRVSAWFARVKKLGLLPKVKMIAPGAVYLKDEQASQFDLLYVYSRGEVSLHEQQLTSKYEFIPLPGPFEIINQLEFVESEPYVFSGGGGTRDFASLIEAVKDTPIKLKIATFSERSLKYTRPLPPNVEVHYNVPKQKFLGMMASALFTAIPLVEGDAPHGHTTVVEAVCLGKAMISTSNASVDDYITPNQEGLVIAPYDIPGYREALVKLWEDPALRQKFESHNREKAQEYSYVAYAKQLSDLCQSVMNEK